MGPLFLLLAALAPPSAALDAARMKCLLARPLILGASVSSCYAATDPGTLLAAKYGTQGAIARRARAGKTSAAILADVTDLEFSTSSVVIALDLFFWDSQEDCARAVEHVAAFDQRLKNTGASLAVGNIPVSGGSCGKALSSAIQAMCAGLPAGCALVDLRTLSLKAEQEGGLDVRDSWITAEELAPDALHPSRIGARLIALDLEAALSASPISCR